MRFIKDRAMAVGSVFALRLRTLGAAVTTDTSAPTHIVHKNSTTPEHPWVAAKTGDRAGQAVRSFRFCAYLGGRRRPAPLATRDRWQDRDLPPPRCALIRRNSNG